MPNFLMTDDLYRISDKFSFNIIKLNHMRLRQNQPKQEDEDSIILKVRPIREIKITQADRLPTEPKFRQLET